MSSNKLATLPGHYVILGILLFQCPDPVPGVGGLSGRRRGRGGRLIGADVGAVVPAQVTVALGRVAHEYPHLVTEIESGYREVNGTENFG